MRKNSILIAKRLLAAFLLALIVSLPAFAVLEGSMRQQMEFLDFSENMIRDGIYPKTGHDVFDKNKRAYVHGIKEHNSPVIYEPDVYTWELAMAEHRKKLDRLAPPAAPEIDPVSPSVTPPPPILPSNPNPVEVTPIGPQAVMEKPQALPSDSDQKMNEMVYRARRKGIYPDRQLRAEEIKQKLLNHMNSLGQQKNVPALMPALPPGSRGDSYDSGF
ncbi:MAG: hypothetical protein ACQETH_11380 [Candidatus Rifleibacteriota bacterium]